MAAQKAVIINAGEVSQIQSGNYLTADSLGSGSAGAGALVLADNNTWIASGSGTVTSVSVASANGFAGTVATPSTTPAITISASVTGIIYGNGTSLSAATISTGLTLSSSTLTSNLSVGVSGGQSAIGGTAVGDALTLKGTTANGTSTVASLVFTAGNNGATTVASLYNDGQFLIGTTLRNSTVGVFSVSQGSSRIDLGEQSAALAAIYLNQGTPGAANHAIRGNSAATQLNAVTTTTVAVSAVAKLTATAGAVTITPAATASGTTSNFTYTQPGNTLQTAGSNLILVNWNLAATIQHAGSTAITLDRGFYIASPTIAFQTATGTVSDAFTFYADAGPVTGTNAVVTRSWSAGFNGRVGIATNLYIGGLSTAATALLHLAAGTATASTAPLKLTSGTNLTIAEAGVFAEYDGTNFYGTPNTTVGRWAHSFNSIQYSTPTTGTTITSTAGIAQLVVNPAGTLLALTITFPASPVNGQTFGIGISQIITTLTLNTSDGSTIDGTITTSSINSNGGWIYSSTANIWFKIH